METERHSHFRSIALLMLLSGMLLLDTHASDFVGPPAPNAVELDDPFPIRRVLLPKDRVAAVLERQKKDEWLHVPRSEFEALVRAASRNNRQRVESPKLAKSHYRAKLLRDTLDENALTGTAEWNLVHSGPGAGIFALETLGIAVANARWTDNRNALLGIIDPHTPAGLALLVEDPGEHALMLDWSARGIPTPGGLRFDIAVPVSPIALLELELPSHLVPLLSQDETLLEGPIPGNTNPQWQSWRIAFGGISRLEISLQAVSSSDATPPMLTSLSSRFELLPGTVNSLHTIEYQATQGDVTALIVEHDSDLIPTDVNVLHLLSWRSVPGGSSGKSRIDVRFREPARGGQLRITAKSPLPLNTAAFWTAPTMSVVGAAVRSESLRIRVPVELSLVDWRPGSFRLARVEQSTDASTLVFEPALAADGQNTTTRPTARFQLAGAEYRLRERVVFEIGVNAVSLAANMTIEVQSGAVRQLLFRLPTGAEVETVEFESKDGDSSWTLQPAQNSLLKVDLARAIPAGSELNCLIRLRLPPMGDGPFQKAIVFPDLMPLGARQRSGQYQLRVDSAYLSIAPSATSDDTPVGPVLPVAISKQEIWTYRYQGQPPVGPLHLIADTPRLTANVDHQASVEGNRLRTEVRLGLHAESGSVRNIILHVSEPMARPWFWRVAQGSNQVVAVEPVPFERLMSVCAMIGARQPISQAMNRIQIPRHRWWRISFEKPLTGSQVLESHYETQALITLVNRPQSCFKACAESGPFHLEGAIGLIISMNQSQDRLLAVPLLRVQNATRNEGTAKVLRPVGKGKLFAGPALIQEGERNDSFKTETAFRLGDGPQFLLIDPHKKGSDASPMQVDSAQLIVAARPESRHHCWFAFRMRGGLAGRISFELADGSKVEAIAVAGRLLRPEQFHSEQSGDAKIWHIAVPGGESWHNVEVLYSVPASNWWFANRLELLIPRLASPPKVWRIEWRLPPGIVPINVADWVQKFGKPQQGLLAETSLSYPINQTRIPAFQVRPEGDSLVGPSAKGTLPKTVQQALMSTGASVEKPLIDSLALVEAGLTDSSSAPLGSWDSVGLTIASFPGGSVLTTRRQVSNWRADESASGLPSPIRDALHDAIRSGRDASGRFRTVADWMESPPSPDVAVLLSRLGGDEPGWTSWESRNQEASSRLLVANTRNIRVVGWMLAAALATIGVLLVGRLGTIGRFLFLFWLFVTAVALQWLPSALRPLSIGPMFAGLLVALVAVCRRPSTKSSAASTAIVPSLTRRRASLPIVGGSVTILLIALVAKAGGPVPETVYLIPGPDSNPEPRSVLVPVELINRLKIMASPRPALTEYALLQSNWTGRTASATAELEARLLVHSFGERIEMELPLGNTRLREALVDGAAAFPKSLGSGRISLEIRGRGEHRIELKLATTVAGTAPDREIRFTIPDSPITRLNFHLPSAGENPQAVNWQGAQIISENGKELTAELGRTKSIHVRWRQGGASDKTQVRVQEAALWDLNGVMATLHAAFEYQVTQGSLRSIKVALPANVDVSRLEIRSESTSVAREQAWIRKWSVTSDRVLSVELQSALSGTFQLVLEAVSNRPLSNRPGLTYPSALETTERESHIAYRLRGLDSPIDLERRGVTEFSAESFLKDIWRPANVEKLPTTITRAFRRSRSENAFLRPTITITPSASKATQELIWQLGPRMADLKSVSTWTAIAEPLTFVEWEVSPTVNIQDVRGSNIQSWHRVGNRVQVWFREPTLEPSLVWYGTLPRGGPPTESMIFELPPVHLRGVQSSNTILRVRASDGWALSSDNTAGIGVPATAAVDRELAYLVSKTAVPARFVLRGPQPDTMFRSLSTVEVVNRRIQVSTVLKADLRRDRPHSFSVLLENAVGWEASLEGPLNSRLIVRPGRGDDRDWVIDIPDRDASSTAVTLTMSRPLASAQDCVVPLPTITQGDRVARMERTVALLGSELRMAGTSAWRQETEKREDAIASQPREAKVLRERGGSVWHGDAAIATMRLFAAPRPLNATPRTRLGLVDIEVARIGPLWICRAAADLVHEQGAKLRCVLPGDGELAGLALDGEVLSLPASANAFDIPLPFESGPRLLQLVWTSPHQTWEPPTFFDGRSSLIFGPVLWTATAMADERIEVTGSHSLAMHDLHRAEALLQMAGDREMVEWSEASLQRVSSRVVRWTRLAEAALASPRSETFASERAPNGSSLNDWASRTREQAQTLRGSRPAPLAAPVRESTYTRMAFANVFQSGMPVRWLAESQASSPVIQTTRTSSWAPLPALASFGLVAIIVGALAVLMLVFSRSTRAEQAAVIGLLGVAAFGPSEGYLFFGLTAVALLVRTVWLGSRFYRWLGG